MSKSGIATLFFLVMMASGWLLYPNMFKEGPEVRYVLPPYIVQNAVELSPKDSIFGGKEAVLGVSKNIFIKQTAPNDKVWVQSSLSLLSGTVTRTYWNIEGNLVMEHIEQIKPPHGSFSRFDPKSQIGIAVMESTHKESTSEKIANWLFVIGGLGFMFSLFFFLTGFSHRTYKD